MKLFLPVILILVLFATALHAESRNAANTVVLDETGVKNLRIETIEAEETLFAETVFALGRIRVAPGFRAVVSSRILGRALSVSAKIDTPIAKGAEVAMIESRQAGNPPPSVRLVAPIGGLVSVVRIVPGQPVAPDDSLVDIIDLSEVHAVAAVPEHLAGQLKVGQKAHLRVVGMPDRTFEADLEHLGAEVEVESGTLEAAFHVLNPDGALRPGMRAEFSIILSERPGVTSVPRSALQGDAANRVVYVEDFDLKNAYIKTPVIVGQMNDHAVEIVSGLLPGDKVVTNGAYFLGFAGGGNVSLKEALDAAHGHEHAADGSELKARAGPESDHDHEEHAPSPFWKILSAALGALLIVSVVWRGRKVSA